jgi:hypothetical protein
MLAWAFSFRLKYSPTQWLSKGLYKRLMGLAVEYHYSSMFLKQWCKPAGLRRFARAFTALKGYEIPFILKD